MGAHHEFPPGFFWGCATAAYQIEGATDEDGRGASIWDTFCARPGAINEGASGRIACDHYHRWREDLDLISSLGIQAYRFSVAWPRVFPSGRGTLNEKGIGFYDQLVDGLLERNIRPFLTCYHWDLPQACEDRGGWRVRETAEAFADYCGLLAARLGDRVTDWFTINELWCAWWLGHVDGTQAPGAREPEKVHRQVCHHLLLGHGLAVKAIRASAPRPVRVGMVPNPGIAVPFTESREDVDFARAEFERMQAGIFGPLYRGAYPAAMLEEWGGNAPDIGPTDMAVISEPTDFVGLNVYSSSQVAGAAWGVRNVEPWYPRTEFSWPVVPESLYWVTRFMHELYAPGDIVIAENGCCYPDQVNAEGRVEDYARVGYLRGYLGALHRAVGEGIPVRGYFAWTLMDNFEWSFGFSKRFGLVHVNYETQARTPKASAHWYARLIENNGF